MKRGRETQRARRKPERHVVGLVREGVAKLPRHIREAFGYEGGPVEVTTTFVAGWGDAWEDGPLSRRGGPPLRLEVTTEGNTTTEVAVVAEVLDDWRLRAQLARTADEDLVVTRIELRPSSGVDEAALGARMLRRLGFGDVVAEAARWLQHPAVVDVIGDGWSRPIARPGRRGREDVVYARWAQQYVDALDRSPRRPIAIIVEEAKERGEHLTESQVRWYLTEARSRGLLTEAPKGKPGGELTAKGRAVLGMTQDGGK